MLGVDFSLYSAPRVITTQEWRQLWDMGYRVAVAGMWTGNTPNPWGRESLYNAHQAGFKLGIYTALNGYQDGAYHVDKAIAQCWTDLEYYDFIWLDCELPGITSQQIQSGITAARKHLQPWIYTRRYWWTEQSPALWRFDHIPLCAAQYDYGGLYDGPDLSTVWPYGYWSPAAGNIFAKQYKGTSELLPGLSFDLVSFL